MKGGVSHFGSVVVNPFLGVSGQPLTRIVNHKLDWVFRASTDVQVQIMICPVPD